MNSNPEPYTPLNKADSLLYTSEQDGGMRLTVWSMCSLNVCSICRMCAIYVECVLYMKNVCSICRMCSLCVIYEADSLEQHADSLQEEAHSVTHDQHIEASRQGVLHMIKT